MESGMNSRDSVTISESSGEEPSLGTTFDSGGKESCSSTRRSGATDSGAMTIESSDKEATASGESKSRASGKSESMARTKRSATSRPKSGNGRGRNSRRAALMTSGNEACDAVQLLCVRRGASTQGQRSPRPMSRHMDDF